MKIKKIVLSLLLILFVTGCSKVNDMTYDEIINNFATSKNSANIYIMYLAKCLLQSVKSVS